MHLENRHCPFLGKKGRSIRVCLQIRFWRLFAPNLTPET
jgi:hypothetical protein